MIHDHHPDPSHEAVSEAARMAAVMVTVIETLVLVSTKDPGRGRRARERDAKVLEDAIARDRLRYQQALDPNVLQATSPTELLATWGVATGWRGLDPDAAEAADRMEQRLAVMYPEVMHRYREALDAGDEAAVAMARAANVLAAEPNASRVVAEAEDSRPRLRGPVPSRGNTTDRRSTVARRQPSASVRRR